MVKIIYNVVPREVFNVHIVLETVGYQDKVRDSENRLVLC